MTIFGQFVFLFFAASFVAAFIFLIGGLCAAFDFISLINKEE
nr:MAG TPA: hypothetical protein [Caudoviricetes sp.]